MTGRSQNAVGASYRARRRRWVARICIGGRAVDLGCFKERADAVAAYQAARADPARTVAEDDRKHAERQRGRAFDNLAHRAVRAGLFLWREFDGQRWRVYVRGRVGEARELTTIDQIEALAMHVGEVLSVVSGPTVPLATA